MSGSDVETPGLLRGDDLIAEDQVEETAHAWEAVSHPSSTSVRVYSIFLLLLTADSCCPSPSFPQSIKTSWEDIRDAEVLDLVDPLHQQKERKKRYKPSHPPSASSTPHLTSSLSLLFHPSCKD